MSKHYPKENMTMSSSMVKKGAIKNSKSFQNYCEDEIDLDDMLSTSTYIYLEDHEVLAKYEASLKNFKPSSAIKN